MNLERTTADVEVSIVSLRGGPRLENCLSALPGACAGLTWRVTLVDNSPSGLDLALHGLPAATVLRSEGRRGFGANQNLVLAGAVAQRRARYVLVLNDDAEPGSSSVTTLVQYADERPRAGAVAPVIAGPDGNLELSVVAWPTLATYALNSMFPGHPLKTATADGFLNGACMLLRTKALAEVGLFDPQYFLFFEETDLCRRLTNAGWHTACCPDAKVVHHKSQTTARTGLGVEMEEQILRSQYLYFRKHHGRLPARVLNGCARSALLVRAAKAVLEVAAGRNPSRSRAAVLWALILFRPGRPTRYEIEARPGSSAASAGVAPQRTACRIGRS